MVCPQELSAYLKELSTWTTEVKAADDELLKGGGSATHGDGAGAPATTPAPRGRVVGAITDDADVKRSCKKARRKADGHNKRASAGHRAGHTYDYYKDKWDRFDVDKALEEADQDHEEEDDDEDEEAGRHVARDSEEPVAEPIVALDPKKEAERFKVEGNNLFKAGDFGTAVSHYSASIRELPTAVAYANRAMAYLKLGRDADAEADCTEALRLDPTYLKAIQRRGTARRQLEKHMDAVNDFEAAVLLEPGSQTLRNDRTQARRAHEAKAGVRLTVSSVPVAVLEEYIPEPSAEEDEDDVMPPPPVRPQREEAGPHDPTKTRPPHTDDQKSTRVNSARSKGDGAAARIAAKPLVAPQNGSEFESSWKTLTESDARARYLQLLGPSSLPKVFKESMTGSILIDFVDIALTQLARLDPDHAVALLETLPSVPRFAMTVMMVPRAAKTKLAGAWDDAVQEAADPSISGRLQAARAHFRL